MPSKDRQSDNSRIDEFGLIADRPLLRRVAISMLAFGIMLEVLYSVAFNPPDWTDVAAVGCALVGCAIVLAVPWDVASPRWIVGPVLLGLASVSFVGIGDNVEVGMSFLFLPAAVLTVIFWKDPLIKWSLLLVTIAVYVIVPAIFGNHQAWIEAAATAPMLLVISILLGALFYRFRNSMVEQGRFRGTITALLMALDARDGHSSEHASAVLSVVTEVAEKLGLDAQEQLHIADVALLHDIGKIGIPNELLQKPANLTEEEWTVMRRHPEIGERILNEVPGFEEVATAVRHEHERWDGIGYPDGRKGDEIPLASRIVLACDAYDAMRSERPYREPLSDAEARQELRTHAGTQFDPVIVDALLAVLERRDREAKPVVAAPVSIDAPREIPAINNHSISGQRRAASL